LKPNVFTQTAGLSTTITTALISPVWLAFAVARQLQLSGAVDVGVLERDY
jgi:hypothetical protein